MGAPAIPVVRAPSLTQQLGAANSIETLRKEGREGRAKVANILRRLASVAKEIEDVEGGEAVSANDTSVPVRRPAPDR